MRSFGGGEREADGAAAEEPRVEAALEVLHQQRRVASLDEEAVVLLPRVGQRLE